MAEAAALALFVSIVAIVAARSARNLAWRKKLTGRARLRDRLQAMRKLDELPEKEFKRMFRLDRATFNAVLKKISPGLERRMPSKAHARGRALPPKLMLACALRFLAGGSYLDICFGFEMSRKVVDAINAEYKFNFDPKEVVDAINAINARFAAQARSQRVHDLVNAEYKFNFDPKDEATLRTLSFDWQRYKGTYIKGIIGAVDGIAIKIRCPGGEVLNPGAYYNRKGFYALVVRAVCDARRRFIYVHANSEGSTPDSVAWGCSSLGDYLSSNGLPSGFFIAGDAAYSCSDALLTPYPGNNLPADKDAFNYFQSYYRIEIECSFGMLNRRWGIFWRPLEMSVGKATRVITCCMKLHNICIDAQDEEFEVDEIDFDGLPTPAAPFDPQDECDDPAMSLPQRTARRTEVCALRDKVCARLKDKGFQRPKQGSRKRRASEMAR